MRSAFLGFLLIFSKSYIDELKALYRRERQDYEMRIENMERNHIEIKRSLIDQVLLVFN